MLSASIIICTKDRREDLRNCLKTVLIQHRLPEELVVVDAGEDAVEDLVAGFYSQSGEGVRAIYVRSEPGLTRQRNAGVEASSGEVVHFLDDDVRLDEAYVEQIQRVFEAPGFADAVAVSPMVEVDDPLSPLSWRVRRFFLLPHIRGDGRLMASGFASYPWNGEESEVREIEVACGCGIAYRRAVFDVISFDEFFEDYGYMEDLDFAVRAGGLGGILLAPKARMRHLESPASRLDARRLAAMQTINHAYFCRKNLPHGWRHRLAFWWSDLGDVLLKLYQVVRRGRWEMLAGLMAGHLGILKGAASAVRAESGASERP